MWIIHFKNKTVKQYTKHYKGYILIWNSNTLQRVYRRMYKQFSTLHQEFRRFTTTQVTFSSLGSSYFKGDRSEHFTGSNLAPFIRNAARYNSDSSFTKKGIYFPD